MQVWNVLHTAHWKYRMQKWRKKSPSRHHRATLSGWIFTTKARIDIRKKNLLNCNISSTCPHNVVNFSPLAAEICWRVWGTPANFNRFCVLASLLQWCPSTEVNQTSHNLWLSPGLVHYIYIIQGTCPVTEFCHMQNSLCFQLLRSPVLAALLHGTWAVGGVVQERELQNFRRGCHLYSAGRPLRWASAHILVICILLKQ